VDDVGDLLSRLRQQWENWIRELLGVIKASRKMRDIM
jgi:hypothetical protein